MSKNQGYKIMAILMFVASGVITVMYTLSNVMGIIPSIVALVQGVGIESGKSFFSYHFVITKSSQLNKKIIFGTLALIAFIISIVATTGFSINMSNKVKNYIVKKSDEYKFKQKYVATQGDLYEVTKKQLEDLKSQRDSRIAGMEKTRDAWGKNYKTAKSLEQDKINSTSAKFNADIATKETELKTIAGTLNQKTGEQNQTEGYEALYSVLAKYVNEARQEPTETKTTTADDISFWMNLFVSIALEFFGIGFIYLSMQEEGLESNMERPRGIHTTNDTGIGFKPQIVTANISHTTPSIDTEYIEKPSRNIIGFYQGASPASMTATENISSVEIPRPCVSQSVYEIDHTILNRYLDYVYSNVKSDGSINGYQTTAKDLSLGVDFIRKLKNHCEHLNILESDSNSRKTFILKPRNEIKLVKTCE